MASPNTRLTRRGRNLLVGFVALVLFATGAFVVLVWKPWEAACSVVVAERTVDLDRDQVEAASIAAAGVVRAGGGVPKATRAVVAATDLDTADATVVARALTGRAKAALTCTYGGGSAEGDELDATGLTARAATVRADVEDAFGDLPLGGFAPGGVSTGHMEGSAHYEGRAIDIFFRPINPANKRHGWAVAQYLVANAERLEVETVIFDGRIWTPGVISGFRGGWREYRVAQGNRSVETLRILEHRDHVHVDVAD